MIVNQRNDGWEVIFQRSHALLAAELASHWAEDYRPQAWTRLLAAILQHDDEERFWGRSAHLTEANTPLDFTISASGVAIDQLTDKLAAMRDQDTYVALLISRHTSFLYEPFRGENKALDDFLDAQKTHQDEWRATLKLTQKDVNSAYALLQWADQLSLILCKRQIPEGGRTLEIGAGPDGDTHMICQREDETLKITPWRFTSDTFTVALETRHLDQPTFKREKALLEALDSAEVVRREWTFAR